MTKAQRHEVYKRALSNFLKRKRHTVLCYEIHVATEYNYLVYDFEEFMAFKCKGKRKHDKWWHLSDKESRLTCLLFCIEMTKP
jgi:hypothetical protein